MGKTVENGKTAEPHRDRVVWFYVSCPYKLDGRAIGNVKGSNRLVRRKRPATDFEMTGINSRNWNNEHSWAKGVPRHYRRTLIFKRMRCRRSKLLNMYKRTLHDNDIMFVDNFPHGMVESLLF